MSSSPYDGNKQAAAMAFGGLGAVIGAALGALLAGPGSGFTGVLLGAAGSALGGVILSTLFHRNA
jgi:hypothetical protein